jgi:GNAT superfamily N-acetyltransferase
MTNVRIRSYETTDLGPCRKLWSELTQHHRDIYSDPSIGGDDPGHHFDAHLSRIGSENIWVAERDDQVVGLVGLIIEDQEAEIEPIVVAPTHRGRGIGRILLSHVIKEAQQLNIRYLSVRPVARNLDAISFFFEAGFRTLGHIELFMEVRSPASGDWKSGPDLFGHAFKY